MPLKRVATGTGPGLFFISGEDLEAGAGEVGGEGGEACLATLLAFVYDREPYFGNKVRDGRVGGA